MTKEFATPDHGRTTSAELECKLIVGAARKFGAANPKLAGEVGHIDNVPGVNVYIRNADQMQRLLPPGSTVLDWGCGFGQMAFLLARRGFSVSACDWGGRPAVPELVGEDIRYFPFTSATKIDLPDASVDVVLSSGTLEHAHNIHISMQEIRRVLKPKGWFVVYRFPNERSISEYVARRSRRWSHAIRMTKRELVFMMRMFSFRVHHVGFDSFLPVFLAHRLGSLRHLRERFDRQWTWLDGVLTRAPIVSDFSTSIYCIAQVNTEYDEVSS